jgi:hypothetical protein
MHVKKLGTYAEARKLCEGKRFVEKGRRLSNSTSIKLYNAGSENEHIAIGRGAWASRHCPQYARPFEGVAQFHPDNRLTGNWAWFSSHELGYFFGVQFTRSRHGYKVMRDISGREVLSDHSIVLRMLPTGRTAVIDAGQPVPDLRKDDDASLEWMRAKRAFDKTLFCALKLGAFDELIKDTNVRASARGMHIPVKPFIQAVQFMDMEAMVRLIAPHMHWASSDAEGWRHAYKKCYAQRRRDILIAAGARIDALTGSPPR